VKVLSVNHSDSLGGAARAAYRLHCALRRDGIDSQMLVNHATLGDWTVSEPPTTLHKVLARVGPHIGQQLARLQKTPNPILHSPAFIPSPWVSEINASDANIVHLHWIAAEMLSIADIAKIRKPVVWTLHDQWAFCGAEHCATADERWRGGYRSDNRSPDESGWDLNRWVWNRKKKAWTVPLQIVGVSHWLSQCARESALMRGWPITTIPNTFDTDVWKPLDKRVARELLGIGEGAPVVAFGAWGNEQPHKGRDLLQQAFHQLRAQNVELRALIFGQMAPKQPIDAAYPIRYMGHLNDDLSLRAVYSAADVMVVPSRIEAFGQAASEALACGTPVVAFDATGLKDIVEHRRTGYLARPFDAVDLAAGIRWVLEDPERAVGLGAAGRATVVERFSYGPIARRYRELYARVLAA
jgi:glycosyltransferase involved in cell wall biosynthesis